MRKFIENLSIGLRLKLAIVIPVNIIVIILGFVLYNYQKEIIFEQAKKNSYASLGDLIKFVENEIDASRDKIGFFGQAAFTYFDGLGERTISNDEYITYKGKIEGDNSETTVSVPAIYRGDTRLQGDTALYRIFKNMGIEFFHYYQKTDEYYVQILNSQNQEALLNNETEIFPLDYSGTWRLNAINEPVFKVSHWPGNTWMQTIRLFIYDENEEIIGAIVVGIKERNENKLVETFVGKTFYESGFCYQASWNDGGFSYHPNLPYKFISDNPAFEHILANQTNEEPSYIAMTDSIGVDKYLFHQYFPTIYHHLIIEIPQEEIYASLHILRNGIVVAVLVIFIFVYIIITFFVNSMTKRLNNSVDILNQLAIGDTSGENKLSAERKDEIGHIAKSVNGLKKNLTTISNFAGAIGQGKLDTNFEALGEKDILGNSLLNMQDSLIKAKHDEELAKIEEEKNRWASDGLAKFSDIIRLSDTDFKDLAYNILKNLVDYLKITMGALYVAEDDDGETVYIPQAAVAYERRKIIDKKIHIGEGLVGRVAHEKLSIYISDIPDDYITIRTGLGTANPSYLLLVPLISNDEMMGVIELASFHEFEDYKRDFVEKLAETIGSTLKSAKTNQQTVTLLEQSKMQSEELAAQEEEMRQNMEELQSTQEEAHRREAEIMGVIESVNKAVFKVEYDAFGMITDVNTKYATFLNTDVEKLLQSNIVSEFKMLGYTGNEAKTILEKLAISQSYSDTIQANIKGKSYTIEEHYTFTGTSAENAAKRIIKISYILG